MERQKGHYWVRNLRVRGSSDEWEVRYWTGHSWVTILQPNLVGDTYFEEIDENRLERKRYSREEIARKIEELRISQSMGDHINDIDDLASK